MVRKPSSAVKFISSSGGATWFVIVVVVFMLRSSSLTVILFRFSRFVCLGGDPFFFLLVVPSVSFFFLDFVALGLVLFSPFVGGVVVRDDVVVCPGTALILAGGMVDFSQILSVSVVFFSILSRFFWMVFQSCCSAVAVATAALRCFAVSC